jgi:hypothetical protein
MLWAGEPMKTFNGVTLICFFVGMLIVCFYAPWTSTSGGGSGAHSSIGFAPIWSTQFLGVPGAHIDVGSMGILAVVVAFFSIVIGGSAYFFRSKRTGERDLME